jgi:hypothetical protein
VSEGWQLVVIGVCMVILCVLAILFADEVDGFLR